MSHESLRKASPAGRTVSEATSAVSPQMELHLVVIAVIAMVLCVVAAMQCRPD